MDAPALQKCMGETRSHSKVLDLLRELVFAQRERERCRMWGQSVDFLCHLLLIQNISWREEKDIEMGLIELM